MNCFHFWVFFSLFANHIEIIALIVCFKVFVHEQLAPRWIALLLLSYVRTRHIHIISFISVSSRTIQITFEKLITSFFSFSFWNSWNRYLFFFALNKKKPPEYLQNGQWYEQAKKKQKQQHKRHLRVSYVPVSHFYS